MLKPAFKPALPLRRAVLLMSAVLPALLLGPEKSLPATPSFHGYVGELTLANPPKAAPDTVFFDADGDAHRLSEYRGAVVLVNFWASWCPACVMEMAGLDRLQAKLGGKHFRVLALSQDHDSVATTTRFLSTRGLDHLSVLIDDQRRLGRAFGQTMLPTTILLDSEGREVGRLVGPAEWDSPEAVALIRYFMRRSEDDRYDPDA